MRTKARRPFLIVATATIVVCAGVALMLISRCGDRHADPVDKIVLGAEASMLPAAVWVAEGKGYFREEGLDVTIKEFDSGRLTRSWIQWSGTIEYFADRCAELTTARYGLLRGAMGKVYHA